MLQPPPPPVIAPAEAIPGRVRLENGLSLTWLSDHGRPTFRLLMRATPRREALGTEEAPLLHLLMVLMRDAFEGTAPAKAVGLVDLPIRSTATWDGLGLTVQMEGTTQALESAWARLGEGLMRPALTTEALERLRSRQRILPTPALERLAADLAVRAGSRCLKPLPLPSERQLDRVRVQDLRNLHARCLGPGALECFVVGDLDARQVQGLMERTFRGWNTTLMPEAPTPIAADPCGRLWVCGSTLDAPEIRLGLCLRGDGTTDPAAAHLLPFLFRRAARKAPIPHSHVLDPATGYCRLRARVPAGKTAGAYLSEVEAWMADLAAHPLTEADLQMAKTAWREWQRALVLHPEERLAWLASGVFPDVAMAARVEGLSLDRVSPVWKARLAPSGRQTLVVGSDERSLQTRTGAGGPAPEVIRVRR